MKRFQKCLAMLFFMLLLADDIYASQLAVIQPKFQINIKTEGGNPKTELQRIRVQYFKPYQPHGLPMFSPGNGDEYIWTDNNGHAEFTLPAFDEPMTMIIGGGIGLFLVERDDDIVINILKRGHSKGDTVTFSGRGAEKYSIAKKLNKLLDNSGDRGEYRNAYQEIGYQDGKKDTTNLIGKIDQHCIIVARFLKKKASIIENSGMSPKMKKLSAYTFAPIFNDWVFQMYRKYTVHYKNSSELRLAVKASVDKYRKQFAYPMDSLMALASWYLSPLSRSEYYLSVLDAGERKIKYEDMYHLFANKYSGAIRELLIANFFMMGYGWRGSERPSASLVDSLMQDGLRYLSTSIISNAYMVKLRLSPGKVVFNGKFKDQNGKEVSMSSLKNKVLLIDFWFTGCGGCMEFHKQFHRDGYPLLKGNKDFVYVSISIDKQKETWLKSIASEDYTSKEYLNLNAEMGVNDPFLKYYERGTFPFVIVVDRRGKIYYSGGIPSGKATAQFINEALRIPYQDN